MSLAVKKQRFQIGFDVLFQNAANVSSSLLSLLLASTGSLVQSYSGPDAVSVPMELLIRFGDNQSKFEFLFQVFDAAPTTSWIETVQKIHDKLINDSTANMLAKAVPSLYVAASVNENKGLRGSALLHAVESQDLEARDQAAISLSVKMTEFEEWVKLLLLQNGEMDSPLDWEVTIRTSRESFTNESELCFVFSPGVFSELAYFTPLGYYRRTGTIPTTVLNVDILFPPLAVPSKGDPRNRSSSHLQTMWTNISNDYKPGLLLNNLPWISTLEATQILEQFSGHNAASKFAQNVPLNSSERLTDIFAETVTKYRSFRAIYSPAENITMTYAELDTLSTNLAFKLKSFGVTGGNVAFMLPRSAQVYVTILAILKTGAAYVPIDPEYPADRVAYIISDSESHLLLTHSSLPIFKSTVESVTKKVLEDTNLSLENELSRALVETLPPFAGSVWCLDVLGTLPSNDKFPCPATPSSLAYIIYTSGSTGRPKGVMLEHRNVCALVRAERHLYKATCEDVIWQGFSIAFDASVEELWLAWANGGTLFCATHEMIHSGPALAEIWASHRLSIVSTVPTLLTMLDDVNLGALRILILGGEACHRDLVTKWSTGRRMINTYGPTEATVIATSSDVHIGIDMVTIGTPIPHYISYIVDPVTLNICPKGVPGELLLGGPALARGYVNREELTNTVFITKTFREIEERVYRTGDLCRWTEKGEIEFMGRIDAQVKLRGFRVELAEIESVLLQSDLIHTAVCHVMTVGGAQQLVAFVIPNGYQQSTSTATVDLPPLFSPQEEADLKEMLRIRLPPYMVPSIFETVSSIPTLPSGKANRKQLPAPRSRSSKPSKHVKKVDVGEYGYDDVVPESTLPGDDLESSILKHVCSLFAQETLSVSANFFELGGHSVLVARLVSLLRKDSNQMCNAVTMADVYNNPTVSSLAAHIRSKSISQYQSTEVRYFPSGLISDDTNSKINNGYTSLEKDEYTQINGVDYYLCWLIQSVLLYFVWSVPAFMLLFAYKFFMWRIETDPWYGALLYTFPIVTCFYPGMLLVIVLLKWILLGRLEPGRYQLWGWWFIRWWFVKKLIEMVPMEPLYGTILLNWYFKALGVNIGKDVYLGTTNIFGFDLVSIGDDCSLGYDSQLEGIRVAQGWIMLGRIALGKRVHIGNRAFVIASFRRDTIIEDNGQLGELSLLPAGSVIPSNKHWSGSPARYSSDVPPIAERVFNENKPSNIQRIGLLLSKFLLFEIMPWFYLAELAPLVLIIYYKVPIEEWLQSVTVNTSWYIFFVLMPLPVAVASIFCLVTMVVIAKWLLLGKYTARTMSIYSLAYIKRWIYNNILETISSRLHPVYSSLYFPPILRLLGAKLGEDVEISTANHFTPDLLDIGDGCFVADDVCLGAPVVHLGYLQEGYVKLGDRSFVGNSALMPINSNAGSHVLVGAMSLGPRRPHAIGIPDSAFVSNQESDDDEPQGIQNSGYRLHMEQEFEPQFEGKKSGNVPSCDIPDSSNWFGAPAIQLPRRIDWTDKFSESQTFNPAWYMRSLRLFIEFFRITLPLTYTIAEFLLFIFYCDEILANLPYSNIPFLGANSLYLGPAFWNIGLLFWPFVIIGSGVMTGAIALILKWLLVGKYSKSEWPLWSSYVWRSELVVAMCESLADPMMMNSLRGTPWISLWLRLMGTSVGSYVYMDSLQITEFDLVTIGDEVTICQDATIQTHLFEDRICKMDQVMIGDYCTVGSLSVVLYCSSMEKGSSLSSLSLLMKNESLPEWSQWHGLPASPYKDEDLHSI